MTIHEKVKAGADALDRYNAMYPQQPVWYDREFKTINMMSSAECILGIVFGWYTVGWRTLIGCGLIDEQAVSIDYGFNPSLEERGQCVAAWRK